MARQLSRAILLTLAVLPLLTASSRSLPTTTAPKSIPDVLASDVFVISGDSSGDGGRPAGGLGVPIMMEEEFLLVSSASSSENKSSAAGRISSAKKPRVDEPPVDATTATATTTTVAWNPFLMFQKRPAGKRPAGIRRPVGGNAVHVPSSDPTAVVDGNNNKVNLEVAVATTETPSTSTTSEAEQTASITLETTTLAVAEEETQETTAPTDRLERPPMRPHLLGQHSQAERTGWWQEWQAKHGHNKREAGEEPTSETTTEVITEEVASTAAMVPKIPTENTTAGTVGADKQAASDGEPPINHAFVEAIAKEMLRQQQLQWQQQQYQQQQMWANYYQQRLQLANNKPKTPVSKATLKPARKATTKKSRLTTTPATIKTTRAINKTDLVGEDRGASLVNATTNGTDIEAAATNATNSTSDGENRQMMPIEQTDVYSDGSSSASSSDLDGDGLPPAAPAPVPAPAPYYPASAGGYQQPYNPQQPYYPPPAGRAPAPMNPGYYPPPYQQQQPYYPNQPYYPYQPYPNSGFYPTYAMPRTADQTTTLQMWVSKSRGTGETGKKAVVNAAQSVGGFFSGFFG